MKSNWEQAQERVNYHFDNFKVDDESYAFQRLGRIVPTEEWINAVDSIVEQSKPATWETRGYKGEGVVPPRDDLLAEELDLERGGYGKDYTITHMNWNIPECFNHIVEGFALEDCMARLHVQKPGEVWNLHVDKLNKWAPDNPESILRVFIQLTNWAPGQFWEFGNYHWNQWRAGEVITFDWANMPHSTANAGYYPRVTLQLTGVRTEQTEKYIASLK
jgi:hypothetical protein